jgi:lipopolysaccharide export system protein LptA
MRASLWFLAFSFLLGSVMSAEAKAAHATGKASEPSPPQQVEVTADKTLEWYQDQSIYVARGNAKAVRGDLTVLADLLTAHQREKSKDTAGKKPVKASPSEKKPDDSGDIDKMTADGHVIILKPNTRITGDHAIDDVDKHVVVVTGTNLRYETDKQVVTARDTLEYWDNKKIAVARGNAVAVKGDRHVEGDVLTAEFRDQPNGANQLYKMTAMGNVTVITKSDVTRGDHAVYDAARDIAIVTGHVRITRGDGTVLTGDVGESDFAANQSRLMNDGSGRVRALLPAKSTSKAAKSNNGGTP